MLLNKHIKLADLEFRVFQVLKDLKTVFTTKASMSFCVALLVVIVVVVIAPSRLSALDASQYNVLVTDVDD